MRLCIYHRKDLDGIGSAAVVRLAYPDCQVAGYDYGEYFPKTIDILLTEEKKYPRESDLFLVDISFPPVKMVEFKKIFKDRFIWCDHHVTAIDDSIKFGYHDLFGSRGTDKASIQHTYSYLQSQISEKRKLPLGILAELQVMVSYLGDYDCWNNKDLERWEKEILPFQWGARYQVGGNVDKCIELLLSGDSKSIVERGKLLLDYERQKNEIMMSRAFTVLWKGLKFLTVNTSGINSDAFRSRWDNSKWDAMMTFSWSPKINAWIVGLYTDKPGLNLSSIAKEMGGGGHAQACGFQYNDKCPTFVLDNIVADPDRQ